MYVCPAAELNAEGSNADNGSDGRATPGLEMP